MALQPSSDHTLIEDFGGPDADSKGCRSGLYLPLMTPTRPGSCRTECVYFLGPLQQTGLKRYLSSRCWGQKSEGRAPSRGSREGSFLPLPAPWGLQASLGVWLPPSSPRLCLHGAFSLCVFCLSPSPVRTPRFGFIACPTPG